MGSKLNEERGEKAADVLFFLVSKVKEEIRQGGVIGIAQRHNMFYDGRALVNMSSRAYGDSKKRQTKGYSYQSPLRKRRDDEELGSER